MPLNNLAVKELQRDLKQRKFFYDQGTYGNADNVDVNAKGILKCGTAMCMAGELYIKAKGLRAYRSVLRRDAIAAELIPVAAAALGIVPQEAGRVQLFDFPDTWPTDLAELYDRDPHAAAIAALDRLKKDGSIKALAR